MIQAGQKRYSLDEAFAYCARLTEAHYENFPVASFFLPEEKRPYIQAIYAFSRTADDFADELTASKEERLQRLDDWEMKLRQCYEAPADHPVFIALRETIKKLDIPIEPLQNLLTAFKRDVVQNRYETFDDLLSYCSCSANPVGRLVLIIFGHRDEKLFTLSDYICTALQLTNFWQDIVVDQRKDRLYIPLEDCQRFGYSLECCAPEAHPPLAENNGIVDEAFKQLLKFEIERTRELFYKGAELPSIVERELQLELRLIWFGGMAILKMIERNGYDVIHKRPKLNTSDKLLILLRAMFVKNLAQYGKPKIRKEPWDLT